ncbi:MAG: hypothetical protein LKE54_10855 [Prevotella sp.]|jgi:hypothetical protein|nr:hypothetical protein [Prevotella sp.]MCH3995517.1 hypothetical protein [Prevotella sp.]
MKLRTKQRTGIRVTGHILMWLVLLAGFSAIVMLLWNWLMPDLFGLKDINFWHALGLLILSKILFGGMIHGEMSHARHHYMSEKWHQMSPEERREFIRHRQYHFRHDFYQADNNTDKKEQ